LEQICFDGLDRRYKKDNPVIMNGGQNRKDTKNRTSKMIQPEQPVPFSLAYPS